VGLIIEAEFQTTAEPEFQTTDYRWTSFKLQMN